MSLNCEGLEELVDHFANEGWDDFLDRVSIATAILETVSYSFGRFRLSTRSLLKKYFSNTVEFALEEKLENARRQMEELNTYYPLIKGYSSHLQKLGYTKEETNRIADNISTETIIDAIDWLRSTGVPIYLSNYFAFKRELYNYFDSEWL